jgi:hypothetical protein
MLIEDRIIVESLNKYLNCTDRILVVRDPVNRRSSMILVVLVDTLHSSRDVHRDSVRATYR